ncbi:T9SS type A sorting domain-containing protein [Moheibacter sediminis]|uniref:Por secretion system C-terminal sorting domain-containing protein n=1 Tax=Moheibacter sediminis TaxID=1434700 RepID=A0A1W2B684_9FLAO|nr:T9SS type A sorting domain-containing protein [Moheibacter sediminis]SMC68192.1 Por secretion system C-terminal sorting domain-containing protein [Moheibacter sediminis]
MTNRFILLITLFFCCCIGTNAQNLLQLDRFTANDAVKYDRFGDAVAVEGDWAVIAAPSNGTDVNGNGNIPRAGSLYVYKKEGNDWVFKQKLITNDRSENDNFGLEAVAINGDYIVAGAKVEDEDANGANTMEDAGSVYIFRRVGETWVQQQKIVAADRTPTKYFGGRIAIDGDYIVIGATGEDIDQDQGRDIGAAYVFKRNGSSWIQQQKLLASTPFRNAFFGSAVDISGNTIIVGADKEDVGGQIYVFELEGEVWQEKQILTGLEAGDYTGRAITLNGEYLISGAFLNSTDVNGENEITQAGAAYIYKKENGSWSYQQKIVASDRVLSNRFGSVVSASGDFLIVGSINAKTDQNGENSFNNAGAAYLFKNVNGIWEEQQKIVASARHANARFSGSIHLNGEYAIIGAYSESANVTDTFSSPTYQIGAAYTYLLCNTDTSVTSEETEISANFTEEGATYQWLDCNNGNAIIEGATSQTFTPTQSGTYAVQITRTNGCVSISECVDFCLVVEVNITNNESVLTADYTSEGITYQWLDCSNENGPIAGATSQTFNPTQSGSYSVQITDTFGCVSISDCFDFCIAAEVSVAQQGTTLTASYSGNDGSYQWINCTNNEEIQGANLPQFIAVESGNYKVRVSDAFGCETFSECVQVCLGVNTNVQVQGNTLTALYAGGTAYQWINCDDENAPIDGATNQAFIASQSGTYAVQITDEFGCVSTSACITVCIPIDLNITVSGEAMTADYNGAGATYQWIDCNNNNEPIAGATGQSFTPQTEGYYAVIITDAYGCVSISECTSSAFLASDDLNVSEFSIYPNPVKDYLNINTGNSSKQPSSYQIYNTMGQLIETKSVKNVSDLKVNVTSYPSGAYILNVQLGKETKSFKFLVK